MLAGRNGYHAASETSAGYHLTNASAGGGKIDEEINGYLFDGESNHGTKYQYPQRQQTSVSLY